MMNEEEFPKISFIMPTLNAGALLENVLSSSPARPGLASAMKSSWPMPIPRIAPVRSRKLLGP